MYRFTGDNPRGNVFHRTGFCRFDRALAVDRFTDRIDNAADQRFTNRYLDDTARAFNRVAILNVFKFPKKNAADVVFFKVLGHPLDAARELQEFVNHGVLQSVYTSNTVTDLDNSTNLARFDSLVKVLDFFF